MGLNHLLMDLTEQVGAFLSSCAVSIKASVPHLRLSSLDSLNPLEPLLPVAAHLVQPPACSQSISLIRKILCPFVHSHPHGRWGTTSSNSLPVSALSSISWLQRLTLVLFSHADCSDFNLEPYSAVLFSCFAFFLTGDISTWHFFTRGGYYSDYIL